MTVEPEPATEPMLRPRPIAAGFGKVFGWLLAVAGLGVFSSLLLSASLYLAIAVRAVRLVFASFNRLDNESTVNTVMIAAVELADAMLVATGLLIVAVGLYSLFVDSLDDVPTWLRIKDFESLKSKLISVVVAALCVRFFSIMMETRTEPRDALLYGGAIGCVLVGLSAYIAALAWSSPSRQTK